MSNEKKIDRYEVLRHLHENLMDLVDDGNLTGDALVEMNDSMAEVAAAVLDCLGIEVVSQNDDGSINVVMRLVDR